ncbi:MAG: Npt1/Npt2 family nucleotide transporter [Candidatus Aminicenantaceae bacterium]
MARNHINKLLSNIVDFKPGEKTISFLLFFYFFLIMVPYYIIKPVRDAKYLIEKGSLRLPIAYLLTAVLIGFFVHFYSKFQAKVPRRILIISSLIFFIVTCCLSGLFFNRRLSWMPLTFWVWANIFGVVVATQFWILVNDIFNPREFRRLTGFFVSGGILGGVVGGLLTWLLAFDFPDYLLFIASGILIISVFIVNYIFIWQKKMMPVPDRITSKEREGMQKTAKVGFKSSFDTVRKNYYLKLLAAVVALTWIVSTFIDWQSKSVIDMTVDVDKMTAFFGYFHAILLVFPFFLSLLLTSNLIKRFGIRFALLIYPVMLLLCSLGIAASPILLFAIIIKASDKSLSFSLNQSVRELLYIPISPELKYKAKVFIDMFLSRFAKGIGALVLLVFIFFHLDWQLRVQVVSAFSAVFILAWVLLNLKTSKEYTNTVKEKLKMKWDRADREVAEKVDLDYTKLVFDTLESKNRSSVLYAMHLFDLIKQDKLTPEVKKLISYKTDEIRASSLGDLFEVEDSSWVLDLEDSLDEEILKKEINEIMSLDVYQEVMKDYIGKVLVDEGKETETSKMEVAKVIGLMESTSPLVKKLEELLRDESREVARYAVESAARLKKREHVPAIIEKLQSPLMREDASAALEKYGSRVIGIITDYLADLGEDIELRKAAASVLARIGTQEAADLLSWELAENKGDIDTELIDALNRIRSEKPDIQFSKKIIEVKIAKAAKEYYQLLIEFYDSASEGKKEEICIKLERNLNVILADIFKLLELIYPREDIIKAYQNVRTGTKDSVAYGLELLDNILKKEIKDLIFPIIESISLEERVRRCQNLLKNLPEF